jgi:restriction system protein
MARKPSREARKNTVYTWVMVPIALIIILLIMNGVTNIYILGGILLSGVIIGSFASSYVPDMRKRENKNKNEYTGLTSKKKIISKNNSMKKTSNTGTSTKQHNLLRSENEILTLPLDELSWREFERLCFLYYKGKGYKVEETPEGPDGGVDLIVHNRHHKAKVAVQIKHRKSGNQVTVKEIRELHAAKQNHGCALADFITSSRYSNVALQEADKFHIKTRDIGWIEINILKWRDQEVKKRKLA